MYISNAVKTLLNIKVKQLFDDIDFRWQDFVEDVLNFFVEVEIFELTTLEVNVTKPRYELQELHIL